MKQNLLNIGETHCLSRTLAKKQGINAAILMAYLANRIEAVQSARKDQLGFYTSVNKLSLHYPYLTTHIISYTLSQLRVKEVIKAERHNRLAGDKTLWYTFVAPGVQRMALDDLVKFDVGVAQHYGVEAALILANIKYWIAENEKKDSAFGWLRVSARELSRHLPIPARTIRRVLQKLSQGANQILERKSCPGFDQAFVYRIADSLKTHGSDSKNDGPDSIIQRPESTLHGPNQDIQWPEPSSNTYCKNLEKNSLEKNVCEKHIQTGPAAPGECVCVSQTHAGDTQNSELASSDSPARPAFGLGEQVTTQSSRVEFAPAETDDASDDVAGQESDASLSPEHKARIFKAAVRVLNADMAGVLYTNTTFQKSQSFFAKNPDLPVKPLLDLLGNCLMRICCTTIEESKNDGYDNAFYVRRANNLSFFFKYLPKIAAWAQSEIAGANFDEPETVNANAQNLN
jgi:hypothetical protein